MKTLSLVVFLLLATGSVFAQTSTGPLEIIKNKWHYIVRNPALDESPFRAMDEQKQIVKERDSTRYQNEVNSKLGRPQNAPPGHVRSEGDLIKSLLPASTIYVYELKIKNTGKRKIQSVAWDYVFFDADGKTEIARKNFVSNSSIKVGEAKTLSSKSTAPPAGIVSVAVMGKKLSDQYLEQIVIQKIIYNDGAVWEAVSK